MPPAICSRVRVRTSCVSPEMRLLITRPEPEAEAMAATLRAAGHEVLIEPMLEVAPVPDVALPLDGITALLVTSANALRALAAHPDLPRLLPLPLFAVGEATAAAARRLGFRSVTAGPGTADALVPRLKTALAPSGRVLHLAGDVLAADLTAPLAEAGLMHKSVVVYQTMERDAFDPAVLAALRDGAIDGVTVLSPRTARVFAGLCRAARLPLDEMTVYCLSAACAAGLGATAARIRIAERPALDALFALIATDTVQLPGRS